MARLILRAPTRGDEALVWAYRQAFLDRGEWVHGSCGLSDCADYAAWLKKAQDRLRTETTPPELVPATTFLVFRDEDGALVGFVNIRHSLNEHFFNYSGHIGYSVHPEERHRGYGREILGQALELCRTELGLTRALVTCNKSNEASRRTILSQGGVLEDERDCDGTPIQRYWIDT